MIVKIIAVFFLSTAIGIMYRIPRKLVAYAGLVGVVAWIVKVMVESGLHSPILATFIGSVAIGLSAEILARILKKPASIFIIPGFIPLVPGGSAYNTIVKMVQGNYISGVTMGMKTVLTGASMAFGIFISATIVRLILDYKNNKYEEINANDDH